MNNNLVLLTMIICHVLHIENLSTTLDEAIKDIYPTSLILKQSKANLRQKLLHYMYGNICDYVHI